MKADLEVIPVRIPMTGGRDYEAVILVARAEGVTGLGEAPVVAARGDSLEGLVAELRSGHPRSRAAHSAWWSAANDARARLAGVRLAKFLGAERRIAIRCSALVEESRPEAVAGRVEALRAEGFTTFKLKAVNAGGQLDLERLGAARWAAGPESRLRLDLNGRRAANALSTLNHLHLELVEQPLPPDAPAADWVDLAAASGVTVAADESLADADLGCQLACQGTALAIKVATVGGVPRALDLGTAATGPVTIGSSYETGIGIAAALHLACVLPREPMACGLATRRLLEADLVSGLTEGPELALPPGPGLGVELDWEAVAHYRVDT